MPDMFRVVRLIIAGGRHYRMTPTDWAALDSIGKVAVVLSGGAAGADLWGERWARVRGIPVERFPADWAKHGRAAGPMRNEQMARCADALALFPGGRGTASMLSKAVEYGLDVHDFRP